MPDHPRKTTSPQIHILTVQHSIGNLRRLLLSEVPARWLYCLRPTPVKSIRLCSFWISKVLAPQLRWHRPGRHQRSLLHKRSEALRHPIQDTCSPRRRDRFQHNFLKLQIQGHKSTTNLRISQVTQSSAMNPCKNNFACP